MVHLKTLYLLLLLITIISCNNNKNNTESEQEKEPTELASPSSIGYSKNDLEGSVNDLTNLIVNPERDLLEKITAEELTYGHSSGLVQNKEEFIDDLINGDFKFIAVNISDQSITIGGETAVVRQTFSAKAKNAGKPIDIHIGNVLVYQNQDGQWKLFARQAFKL